MDSKIDLRKKIGQHEYETAERFLGGVSYHISDETFYKIEIPPSEEVLDSWGKEGIVYMANHFFQDDILSDSVKGALAIDDQSTFEFILKNLPGILKNNKEDLTWEDHGTVVEPELIFGDIRTLLKIIEAEENPMKKEWEELERTLSPGEYSLQTAMSMMYGPGPFEKFRVARKNLHSLPVKVLRKENLFGSPRDEWLLFHSLCEWIITQGKDRRQELFDSSIMEHQHYDNSSLVQFVLQEIDSIQGVMKENLLFLTYWSVQDKGYMVGDGYGKYHDYRDLAKRALDFYHYFCQEQPGQRSKVFPSRLKRPENISVDVGKLERYLHAVNSCNINLLSPQLDVEWKLKVTFRGERLKGVREYAKTSAESIYNLLCSYQNVSPHLSKKAIDKVRRIYFDEWKQNRNSGTLEQTIKKTLHKLHFDQFHSRTEKKWEGNPPLETLITLLQNLRDKSFYRGNKPSENYINALNRLIVTLQGNFQFDSLIVEQNKYPLYNLVNSVGDCLSQGGNYEQYGSFLALDPFQGILALNTYKEGTYQDTIGKAFLAECQEKDGTRIMYIDGVVMNEDIQDMIRDADKNEPVWMPLFTKAFLQNAVQKEYPGLIMNTQHKSAQLSVWAYLHHFAELLDLKKGQQYKYKDPRTVVRPGVTKERDVTNRDGFMLTDCCARENVHYVEKVNTSERKEYFLSGFWINQWNGTKGGYSHIQPGCLPPERPHKTERQTINEGKGYIIGLRLSVEELIPRFNRKYGKEYGEVKK